MSVHEGDFDAGNVVEYLRGLANREPLPTVQLAKNMTDLLKEFQRLSVLGDLVSAKDLIQKHLPIILNVGHDNAAIFTARDALQEGLK